MKILVTEALIVLAVAALAGCATSPSSVTPVVDSRFCPNGLAKRFTGLNNEYYRSVAYSCTELVPKDLKGKSTIVTSLPQDAKFIGGQVISFKKTGTPNKEMIEAIAQPNSVGANILLEDISSYIASPETHYYRLYYSESSVNSK